MSGESRAMRQAMDLKDVALLEPSGPPSYTYVAGPMTGYPEYNEPAFRDMADRLRRAGIKVISPNELHAPDPDKAWDWYLRRDLVALATYCNRVVFLQGWERSKGATLEHATAVALGMELVYPFEHEALFEGLTGCPKGLAACGICKAL